MSFNGHFYILLTVQWFRQFICPRIALVNDFYSLHTFSLNSQFVPVSSKFLLKIVNESVEEFQNITCDEVIVSMVKERPNHNTNGNCGLPGPSENSDEF